MLFPAVKRTLDTGARLRAPENGRKANEAAAQTCSQKRMEKRYQIINAKVLFCEAPAWEIDERLLPHCCAKRFSKSTKSIFHSTLRKSKSSLIIKLQRELKTFAAIPPAARRAPSALENAKKNWRVHFFRKSFVPPPKAPVEAYRAISLLFCCVMVTHQWKLFRIVIFAIFFLQLFWVA